MSETPHTDAGARRADRHETLDTDSWLCLAATPTFALMALLTGGPMAMMCSTAQEAFPLDGMVVMYMLMSVFHASPWLRLISGRRGAARRL